MQYQNTCEYLETRSILCKIKQNIPHNHIEYEDHNKTECMKTVTFVLCIREEIIVQKMSK
jgi:hypothetical protein